MSVGVGSHPLGCWRDNFFVERLWRTVKYEEVFLYATVAEARAGLGRYLSPSSRWRDGTDSSASCRSGSRGRSTMPSCGSWAGGRDRGAGAAAPSIESGRGVVVWWVRNPNPSAVTPSLDMRR